MQISVRETRACLRRILWKPETKCPSSLRSGGALVRILVAMNAIGPLPLAPSNNLSGNPDFPWRKSIKGSGINPSVHLWKKYRRMTELWESYGCPGEPMSGCLTVYQLNTFKILSQSASGIFSTHSTHAYKHFRYWRLRPHIKHIFRCEIHQLCHMYHQKFGPYQLDIGHWDFYIFAAIEWMKITTSKSKWNISSKNVFNSDDENVAWCCRCISDDDNLLDSRLTVWT